MTKNANPSIQDSPANNDTLAGVLQFVLAKFQAWNTDDMLPVQVIAFDATSFPPVVQVQPLITMVDTNNDQTSRAQYASIPVLTIGAGGFLIYFNIKPGDLGFIKSNDRDLGNFFEQLGECAPGSGRTHSFSDGIFIPAVLSNYVIDPSDTGMVIQNSLGTVKISLTQTGVTIVSPTTISITSPIVNLTGNLNVIGNITATGTITPGV